LTRGRAGKTRLCRRRWPKSSITLCLYIFSTKWERREVLGRNGVTLLTRSVLSAKSCLEPRTRGRDTRDVVYRSVRLRAETLLLCLSRNHGHEIYDQERPRVCVTFIPTHESRSLVVRVPNSFLRIIGKIAQRIIRGEGGISCLMSGRSLWLIR
ncbi:unnamed protein product, partial [Ectocarpus fasciculatus]